MSSCTKYSNTRLEIMKETHVKQENNCASSGELTEWQFVSNAEEARLIEETPFALEFVNCDESEWESRGMITLIGQDQCAEETPIYTELKVESNVVELEVIQIKDEIEVKDEMQDFNINSQVLIDDVKCGTNKQNKRNSTKNREKPIIIMPVSCDECDYTCADQSILDKHREYHQGPKRCSFCNYTCYSQSGMTRHQSIHGKKPDKVQDVTDDEAFHCDECNCVFFSKSSMTRHINFHAQNRSKAQDPAQDVIVNEGIYCEECDYICFSKRGLTMHKKVHYKRPEGHFVMKCVKGD